MAYPHPTYVAHWLLRYGTDDGMSSPLMRSAADSANRARGIAEMVDPVTA